MGTARFRDVAPRSIPHGGSDFLRSTSYFAMSSAKSPGNPCTTAYHRKMVQERVDASTERPGRFSPLPDEALDALVTVLDEIRFGRSRSRSEVVTRTGLGRAIVAQRVGELIERGLVTEGDVGPSTGGRPPRQLTFRA